MHLLAEHQYTHKHTGHVSGHIAMCTFVGSKLNQGSARTVMYLSCLVPLVFSQAHQALVRK